MQEVHEAYVQAGAEILETNTFGANPVKLAESRSGRRDRSHQPRAVEHRPASGRASGPWWSAPSARWVSGWSPGGRPRGTRRSRFFSRQVSGLLEGGVDGFILETFSDLHEMEAALCAVRGARASSRSSRR